MKRVVPFLILLLLLTGCLKEPDNQIKIEYAGEQLRYVNCPLGGIGTGNILLNGYGAISEIEIFNRASMDELPPDMTFFSLWARQEGALPVARILEGEPLEEYPNPFGQPRQQLGGIPRFREVHFRNEYPVAAIDYFDEQVPLKVSLNAWSPFIPVDPVNSGLPVAVFEWTLVNPGNVPVEYSLSFCMANPMVQGAASGNGPHITAPYDAGGRTERRGLLFSAPEKDSLLPDAGRFLVTFTGEGELSTPLFRGGWWDNAHIFWNDFSVDGKLEPKRDTAYSQRGGTDAGSFYISGSLQPGEEVTLPVVLSWYVPYRLLESSQAFGNKGVEEAKIRNYYTTLFSDVESIDTWFHENREMLRERSFSFSEAMYNSTVPKPVLDAAISNMSALKTNLLLRDDNGHVHGFEGLGNDFGCCPGNCTHVWNYAQTMAALFPSLERDVRYTGFTNATHQNGYQCFRTVFPLSDNWFKNVAADGQMGNIMRVYREWKMSGNSEWLGEIWPAVKSALEFAWKGIGEVPPELAWMKNSPVPWDPYKEGVLRGDQHNTYDINFYGPNMMTGSLYLGALKACSEMAMAMNEPQKSVEYMELYRRGSERYMELLWNGEYFIQEVEVLEGLKISERLMSPPDASGRVLPKYQYADGCLSDQLLGQYLAFVSGMGYIMDSAVTRTTLKSIHTHNFREQMRDFENVQRIYAAHGEAGLVICTWPHGNKPLLPFVYSDEVWTGIEYQVAASMIYAGLVDEGLEIVGAVRERYRGDNRNPFAEIESGRYYARALSSWAVYQAMAGYVYDGIKGTMQFAPAVDVLPIRFFWSTGTGWGTIEASRAKVELKCIHGSVNLKRLELTGKSFFVFREFEPSHPAEIEYAGNGLKIDFSGELTLQAGEVFSMVIP